MSQLTAMIVRIADVGKQNQSLSKLGMTCVISTCFLVLLIDVYINVM